MRDGTPFYQVKFFQPPLQGDEQTEFFFSSLAAIYDHFTPEQVGCCCQHLYNLKVSDGNTYSGAFCEIKKQDIRAKAQKRPCKGETRK